MSFEKRIIEGFPDCMAFGQNQVVIDKNTQDKAIQKRMEMQEPERETNQEENENPISKDSSVLEKTNNHPLFPLEYAKEWSQELQNNIRDLIKSELEHNLSSFYSEKNLKQNKKDNDSDSAEQHLIDFDLKNLSISTLVENPEINDYLNRNTNLPKQEEATRKIKETLKQLSPRFFINLKDEDVYYDFLIINYVIVKDLLKENLERYDYKNSMLEIESELRKFKTFNKNSIVELARILDETIESKKEEIASLISMHELKRDSLKKFVESLYQNFDEIIKMKTNNVVDKVKLDIDGIIEKIGQISKAEAEYVKNNETLIEDAKNNMNKILAENIARAVENFNQQFKQSFKAISQTNFSWITRKKSILYSCLGLFAFFFISTIGLTISTLWFAQKVEKNQNATYPSMRFLQQANLFENGGNKFIQIQPEHIFYAKDNRYFNLKSEKSVKNAFVPLKDAFLKDNSLLILVE